jgi:TonB family protein
MKLLSGKRIGQSGYELILAVFFSFFIHAAVVAVVLFFYVVASPKVSVPPYYSVKLVRMPETIAPTAVQQPAPLPPPTPKEEKKAEPKKTIKAAPKSVITMAKKNAMPEISEQKQKLKQKPEEVNPSEPSEAQQQKSTSKTESSAVLPPVAVSTPVAAQEEFKYDYYLEQVKNRIGRYWNPPPDTKDAKVRVIFAINRSGVVIQVNIDTDHSNGTEMFKQAALRAITSSTFPPLPDDYGKQSVEFTVDLMAAE